MQRVLPRPSDIPLSGRGRPSQAEPGGSTGREDGQDVQERPGVQQPPAEDPGEDPSEGGERFV